MIHDVKELSASLHYASGWTGTVEGLRRDSEGTDAALLPTTSAGPLAELRRVIAEAREFVEGLAQGASTDYQLSTQENMIRPEDKMKVASQTTRAMR